MATAVIMPKQGQSVESCVITHWEKHVGDQVHVGDCLFIYETDKASFEEEAKTDGTLLAIFYEEQDDVPCMSQVAVIGVPGEDLSGFGPQADIKQVGTEDGTRNFLAAEHEAEIKRKDIESLPVGFKKRTGISPRARATAERLCIKMDDVVPTGPHGRVLERDVLAANRQTVAAYKGKSDGRQPEGTGLGGRVTVSDLGTFRALEMKQRPSKETDEVGYHDEKLSRIRQHIASSMHNSLLSMAQLTHHTSFDASAIAAYRQQMKTSKLALPSITYNDIVLYAVSRIIKRHPSLNANWIGEDTIRYFHHVHLGMAVDTPRGLLVPTIFDADRKSLIQISKEAKELAEKAQTGAINPDFLTGATFTVSNLGTLDIEMFTPVINPPQTAILGVDCMVERVRRRGEGIEVYPTMGLSLTYDHRAMDGAPASRFLKELKTSLEEFSLLLAE